MGEIRLKPCPFCGGKVREAVGINGLKFFCCTDYKNCGAVISFDQKLANHKPEMSRMFYNHRAKQEGEQNE